MRAGGVSGWFLAPAVLGLAVFAVWWHFHASFSRLQAWADENGLVILRREYRTFFRGPFFWTSSKGQTVYRVTVRDKAGHVLDGWVRCGSWWWGLLSPRVEVRWDEVAPPQKDPMMDRWGDV
jgi:hypothetical protein